MGVGGKAFTLFFPLSIDFSSGTKQGMFKVDVPNLVVYLHPTPMIDWNVVRVSLQESTPNRHVFKRVCSKYDNHWRLSNRHQGMGGGDLYDQLPSTRA